MNKFLSELKEIMVEYGIRTVYAIDMDAYFDVNNETFGMNWAVNCTLVEKQRYEKHKTSQVEKAGMGCFAEELNHLMLKHEVKRIAPIDMDAYFDVANEVFAYNMYIKGGNLQEHTAIESEEYI